ncbi:MAG: hypothetical protein RBT80_00730 [Candidatus Vecturithrix sp.]|jgi:WD40 repeat protein|nr:hypothetical protein [Candidatus Vecturithrix sp.]
MKRNMTITQTGILFYPVVVLMFMLTGCINETPNLRDTFLYTCGQQQWQILTVELGKGFERIVVWKPHAPQLIPLRDPLTENRNQAFDVIRTPSFGATNQEVLFARNNKLLLYDLKSETIEVLYEYDLTKRSAIYSATLSPDTKTIAFLVYVGGDSYALYILDRASKLATNVLPNNVASFGKSNMNISWTPDSRKILYADITGKIYMIDIHTLEKTFVIVGFDPLCSPDGQKLLFAKHQYKPYKGYIYNFSDHKVKKIRFLNLMNAIWTPDSRYILVAQLNKDVFHWNEWRTRVRVINPNTQQFATLFTYKGFENLDCK